MCQICDNPQRLEIEAELNAAVSMNATAKKFGLVRRRLQEHVRNCLHIRISSNFRQKTEKQIRNARLSGQLESALAQAEKWIEKSAASFNTKEFLAAQRHKNRILGMIQKSIGRVPIDKEVTIDGSKERQGPVRIVPPLREDFPEEMRGLWDRFFSPLEMGELAYRQRNLPADAPLCRIKIDFQESPLNNYENESTFLLTAEESHHTRPTMKIEGDGDA
jgi:hypothetical protein